MFSLKNITLLLVKIICVLYSNDCLCQYDDRWIIEYKQSGILLIDDYKGVLFLNASNSKYVMMPKRTLKDSVGIDIENLKFSMVINRNEPAFYLKDFLRATLYSNPQIFHKNFLVEDSIPSINWNIHDEEKVIASTYTCQKAVGKFRGRIYTAWFTEQIPISNGPWKLGGLPGLILEAYDKEKEVGFEFASLKKQPKDGINLNKELKKIDSKKAITWEQYVSIYRKKMKSLAPALQSQMSGNVTVKVTKFSSIEKIMIEDEN